MSILKTLSTKESTLELKRLQKQQPSYLSIRLQMPLLMKTKSVHSKRGLADSLGVSANTIQSEKIMYDTGGLIGLLDYKRGGNKLSVIAGSNEKKIFSKLSDPHNASGSFKELQQWVDENLIKGIIYCSFSTKNSFN